jgi:hypothetical protein
MSIDKSLQRFTGRSNPADQRVGCQIAFKATGVVDLWHEAAICQGGPITVTEDTRLRLLQHGFNRIETNRDPMTRPCQTLLIAQTHFLSQIIAHPQIVQWCNLAGDGLRQRSYPGTRYCALWQQWPVRVTFVQIFHDGDFGKWVADNNAVIKINRTLFVHGGLGPEMLGRPISEINEQIRTELKAGETGIPGLAESEQGPLWYRGLASNDEVIEAPHVDALLTFYDVDRIVIGHTPGYGTIVPRFGGKVLMIDTGISAYYGAHLASLIIEGDTLLNNQRGKLLAIPTGDTDPLPYFLEAAALEPDATGLQRLINSLQD